jgi:hypothetical protein
MSVTKMLFLFSNCGSFAIFGLFSRTGYWVMLLRPWARVSDMPPQLFRSFSGRESDLYARLKPAQNELRGFRISWGASESCWEGIQVFLFPHTSLWSLWWLKENHAKTPENENQEIFSNHVTSLAFEWVGWFRATFLTLSPRIGQWKYINSNDNLTKYAEELCEGTRVGSDYLSLDLNDRLWVTACRRS